MFVECSVGDRDAALFPVVAAVYNIHSPLPSGGVQRDDNGVLGTPHHQGQAASEHQFA